MAGMINCMRFKPKAGQAEDLFKAYAEYVRDYPFDDIMHKIIDLGDGEFALIGIHHSVDSFIDIMNRDNRWRRWRRTNGKWYSTRTISRRVRCHS